jgi:molybdopterin/thiamine biosynthesis adenylyltransferase
MSRRDVDCHRPLIVDPGRYLGDPTVTVVDELQAQLEQLARCRAPREGDPVVPVECEGVWFYYPWRRTLVHVLPRELHRELRFDRNHYAITAAEQERLLSLTVCVAGLSVGRAVVTTLVHEGVGGELRLADFDVLDLSNLNRITGGVADVGVSKVVLAAREVAELDPYVEVKIFPRGVEVETVGEFVDGADVVVDECDGLEIKVLLRERARAQRIPIVMATSQRGMLDVERFDLEPERPLFHGLLDDVSSASLAGLTTKQKVPYVIRILDPTSLSPRAAASMIEVKESVSTWPQVASDVALGGAMVTNAVRRIALRQLSVSGRLYCDLDELVPAPIVLPEPPGASTPDPRPRMDDDLDFVVACACTAPSGGNMQPWRFETGAGVVRAWLDSSRTTSLLDFRDRAAYFSLGAALEAATVGARARGYTVREHVDGGPVWELALTRNGSRDDAAADILWQRSSHRRTGASLPVADLAGLAAFGAPLHVDLARDLRALGTALGTLDRVRLLSPRLRQDMIGELRFSAAEALERRDGIEVAALELDSADRAAMDVLKTGIGMDVLAELDRGWGLGNLARDAFAASGGALILRAGDVSVPGLVAAGRGLMRLWLEATRRGLAIHPWGSPFLFQHLLEDPSSLTDWERAALTAAADGFELDVERPILLVLRVSRYAAPPRVRSLRRPVEDVMA